jgi:hypothetical protein
LRLKYFPEVTIRGQKAEFTGESLWALRPARSERFTLPFALTNKISLPHTRISQLESNQDFGPRTSFWPRKLTCLEAVLKFGYERLLKQKPVNKKGHALMLNDLIQAFRGHKPSLIPRSPFACRRLDPGDRKWGGSHAADIANSHYFSLAAMPKHLAKDNHLCDSIGDSIPHKP